MEFYKHTACVTFDELTAGPQPIIRPDTLRQNLRRGNIQCARQGGGEGHYALYVFHSLPAKYRTAFVQRYGNPEELLRERLTDDSLLQEDTEARAFYEDFKYCLNGVQTHLSQQLIDEYTRNAAVIRLLLRRQATLLATSNALGNGRRSDLWDILLALSEKLRLHTPHTLPHNLARLREKLSQFRTQGYASLISGKLGNANTLKITPEAGERLIALKRSRTPVLTDAQIFQQFNLEADQRGWKPLRSIRSLKQWLDSPAVIQLWNDAVYGELATHQHFDRRHRTELPTLRDALWYGDGTKLNLYYRDDEGKVRTTSVYEVIDAATETFIGFHIADTEDYEAQYHAFRMAIQVSGHKPYEIVVDNQGGHRKLQSQHFFDRICRVHRTTAPYNGASKTIESVFGRFQQQVLHQDWRFTGQNVTAKKLSSRPNTEFIEANKDKLYTLPQLKEAYLKARTRWNEMQHPATGEQRIKMYLSSQNPETPAVTPADMVEMFWVTAERMSTFTSSGIEITVKGRKRAYEVMASPGVPDFEWRRTHTYQKFVVKYDPYDFSSIRLYSRDKAGQLRFERVAEPYIVVHRALQDQAEGEAAFIRQQQEQARQSRIDRQAQARAIELSQGVAPEQNGLRTPALKAAGADTDRQILRRLQKYSLPPEELSPGPRTKQLSLTDWTELNPQPADIDLRRVAEKL